MSDDAARDAQLRMWTVGDYDVVAEQLRPISEATVAALDIQPGERVLDIAVGSGNAAVLAARRGAAVTGIDLTPAQLDKARTRCQAEGMDVDLRQGDAQALDVPDGAFDVVLSVMGVIFAPRHKDATRELVRACRPGGRIAITAWTVGGWGLLWRAKVAELVPDADPPAGPSPDQWGDPHVVEQRFAAAGLDVTIERRDFQWRYPSAEAGLEMLLRVGGPFIVLMETMEARGLGDATRTALLEVMHDANVATDGTCALAAPYLLVTATR